MSNTYKYALNMVWLMPGIVLFASNLNWNRVLVLVTVVWVTVVLAACSVVNRPEGWAGAVVLEEVIYAGTKDGELVALNRTNGEKLWHFELLGDKTYQAIYGTPTLSGDILYLSGYDGHFYVFDVSTSKNPMNWRDPVLLDSKKIGDPLSDDVTPIVTSPAVVDEDCSDTVDGDLPCQVLMVGTDDGNVYTLKVTLDSMGGAYIQEGNQFSTGGKIWSDPVIQDGVAYFGSLDHRLYAVEVETSKLVWNQPFETKGGVVASPTLHQGKILFGSFDGEFYALDLVTGQELWRFSGADNWYWGTAKVAGGLILAPSLDGKLYALDVNTGSLKWVVKTDKPIVNSPAIISDFVVIASDDGRLRIVSLTDGDLEGACTVEEKIRTPLTVDDRVIFLGAGDNTIRAFSVGSSGDVDEEWIYFADEDKRNATRGIAC